MLAELETVEHVVVNGRRRHVARSRATGARCTRYEDAARRRSRTTFDWPEVDERDAAAMCYTSGTTGNPKGVVYSHRSIYLHSMQVCMADGVRPERRRDRVLAVVPQFHAMAWGLPYAALMAGASLLMPDRFLQPEPLLR